ncbi:PhnD/SsuA/transferrin family substrate-binding protein [Kaistia dalseonensis]|uniref:ABC-type phosphate/phosphonate transport system substrate-binding protein n=1 Tax=Kaistia dalseonensis TaxID=410840 RepID=A0ABU0H824_9HYPH|nr:PhnD/SsuA/transferrin family substrate-binding protein [Kaistia dalseonensis]MCX5495039.1 PhnD/SsuA/transferrin family substrate-binding protein [Kaistia dalseonensis]MDQ0437621.1 ABC-type phosphate/phosphonate transport system substrate-binding protein [Kaistia dalseonensis]
MIASLPMYGVDPAAVERFWGVLAAKLAERGLADVPAQLAWPDDLAAHWRAPDLLISQACGYPLVQGLSHHVRVVGAFCYAAEGCTGSDYRSRLVTRKDLALDGIADFRGRTVAFNSRDSQSGYNGLRALVAPLQTDGRFFGATVETGAHRRSIEAVLGGAADIAAIDCVTLALIARSEPEIVAGLKDVGATAPAPGLPVITSATTSDADLERLRQAIEDTVADPALAAISEALLIAGFERLDLADYARCTAMRDFAIERGYPELA